MDFNENEDDFDSFFTTKNTKTANQKRFTKNTDPLDDLFGLEEKATTSKTATASIAKTNTSLIREEPENDDLGLDPKKPKAVSKTKNLFDDLLGPLETKRPQTAGVTQGVTKAPISRQSTDTTTDTSNVYQNQNTRPKTSQGRRTSNIASNVNPDPLGLFTKDKDMSKSPSNVGSPKIHKRGTTADWLGLAVESETEHTIKAADLATEASNITKANKTLSKETAEILTLPDHTETQDQKPTEHSSPKMGDNEETHLKVDSAAQNIMLMNTLNIEAKQSFAALKYQEQQLTMASQMKQQERLLMDMQRKQDALLQQQEKQFQQLFQQQIQRQQQLEDLIQQQQLRIQHHLQLLMTQPALQTLFPDLELQASFKNKKEAESDENEVSFRSDVKEKENTSNLLQIESDNKRFELENLRLEELIANTKSNYEREIELLENSYKKQIEVLEKHLSTMEKRLKTEIEELQIHYQTKIEILEQEKQTLKKSYEEDFTNLKQDHEDELRKLRKTHEEDLDLLMEEHRRMLDNIRQAKMLEFAAIQENGSYLECLKVASSNLKDLTGGLAELKENMKNKIELQQLEREKKLEQREKLAEDAERRLKINEEANEQEKQRLMDLVSTLELQMGKMSKESAEENWQVRQKLASLDAEKLAFNKEKEFFREQLLRDEERIKELKEHQLLETQRLQLELQEERSQLQIEKTKFELEKRLQNQTDLQKERLEVEAAMQVAQDAARKADQERERFFKMQRQLEQEKRELSDKEHALNVREEELHQELLSYRMAEKVAQETQQKAKLAEQFYQNKLQLLQQRVNELNEKETNLSQERLLLAQDRIAMHALKMKLTQQPKCSLCQLSQKNQKITQTLQDNSQLLNNNKFLPVDTVGSNNYDFLTSDNVVERLLDANIADSIRRMHATSNIDLEWENLLDDDHKKMVQNEGFGISNNNNI